VEGQIVADGEVELSDGTKLRFRTTLIDIKEIGFSYFDGVNFNVSLSIGVSTISVPQNLKDSVSSRPLSPAQLPQEGWETVDIVGAKPATLNIKTTSSKGNFEVKIVTEPMMVARNLLYKNILNEPLYILNTITKYLGKKLKNDAKRYFNRSKNYS